MEKIKLESGSDGRNIYIIIKLGIVSVYLNIKILFTERIYLDKYHLSIFTVQSQHIIYMNNIKLHGGCHYIFDDNDRKICSICNKYFHQMCNYFIDGIEVINFRFHYFFLIIIGKCLISVY